MCIEIDENTLEIINVIGSEKRVIFALRQNFFAFLITHKFKAVLATAVLNAN